MPVCSTAWPTRAKAAEAAPPGGAERPAGRLRWWAVALPAVAFGALLTFVAGTAQAGPPAAAQPLAALFSKVTALLAALVGHVS
ncbi:MULTISPECIES: hypothetical protein [Streptomycetaceae]|nr:MULTISPECIES: hypothetical protein [Streptomycetaceae]MYS58090.1 hypothetical protein [Streptomyces sp. SID5468]CCB73730.1 putative Predicted protein [Streptantibioticus cattleyicolor NRRL 8057 = DSM 46488]